MREGEAWPSSAWGKDGLVMVSAASKWPENLRQPSLASFLAFDPHPLSLKAADGFLRRALKSSLKFDKQFLDDLSQYVKRLKASGKEDAT